jgi:hypothetical protein
LTGPGTMFDGPKGTQIREIRDGCSNTILLVEAKRDIPWTKPDDIPYDPKKPLPKLGGFFGDAFNVVMVDGSARTLSNSIEEAILRALATKSDGRVVQIPETPPTQR